MNIRPGFNGQFPQRNNNMGSSNSWQSQNNQAPPSGSGTWDSGQAQDTMASLTALGNWNSWQSQQGRTPSSDQASQAWDISAADANASASNTNTCSHGTAATNTTNTPSSEVDDTTGSSEIPSGPSETAQGLAGLQQALITMISLFTQMMSGLFGNQPASTAPALPPGPAPVIVPSQMDFSNDTDLKQRQYDLLGGKNSQIDSLINKLNNADPLSSESETIQGQIGDLWAQANGDPNALKEYKALQTVIKENTRLSWLSAAQQNLEPNSAEYINMGIQIDNSQTIRQTGITTAQSLETAG